MHRCRTMLDKDLINTGIYESAGKQSLPLVQLVQQLLRYLHFSRIMPHLCIYTEQSHADLFTHLVSAGTSPPRLSRGWRMLLGGSPTIWRRSMSARSALRLWTCCCASRGCWLASSTWVSMAQRTSMDTVSHVFQVSSDADKINWLSS